ncbi:MAG: F0F1 ATP synthase subunit A, partial [Dietzia sp.]|nr:F0F1 ATP synthase subunit A [Dietzia sp.]
MTDFAGGAFTLDRLMLVRLLMAVVLLAFLVIAMRNPKLVPRGVQNVAEICLDFVRVHI